MNNSKFSIVEFGNNEGVAVISSSWIYEESNKTRCYWPSMKSSALCNRAVEKCCPAEPSWKSFDCRILYSTDDYAKARSKARDAEMTSSLESERETTSAQKEIRKRNRPQMYGSSSESGSDVEQPAKQRRGIQPKTIAQSQLTVPTPPLPPPTLSEPPFQPLTLATSQRSECQSEAEYTPRSSVQAGRNSTFERHVLTLLQEVKDGVLKVSRDIAVLMATQQKQASGHSDLSSMEEMPEDICFPMDTIEEVKALEGKLRDDANFKQLIIRNISCVGGTSLRDCTRRLLRHLFTNRCAKHLNWKGRGGKMALAGISTSAIIIRAVRMNPLSSNATDAEIESQIKDWLKFATERDGGRKKRAEKQRQSGTTQSQSAHDDSEI